MTYDWNGTATRRKKIVQMAVAIMAMLALAYLMLAALEATMLTM